MNSNDKIQQLARLQQARILSENRLQVRQRRIDQRFDELEKRITAPNDTRQRVISAALELLDEEGLNELSLRKLAAKVGLKAPALYWYFKNKEELVDYMAEAILAKEFADLQPRASHEIWQDWLVTTCIRLRRAMLSHRDGARIVAGAHLYPAITLAQLMETASESLSSAGLDDATVDLVVGTAIHFCFGRVIEEQSSPSLEEIQTMDPTDLLSQFPRLARTIGRIQASGTVYGFGEIGFERSIRLIVR